ncbi:MAG: hypothetical protein GF307_02455 [candidate division Zixibacteria bacterium]|nr:hypothetical protein [candidate division Zixibacteria bacterium]
MKKIVYFLLFASLVFFIVYWYVYVSDEPVTDRQIQVLLLYEPGLMDEHGYVLKAYESVLKEEGVPYTAVKPSYLRKKRIEDFVAQNPVIILPDGVLQIMPEEMSYWINEYLGYGGNIAVIYNPGVKDNNGAYLEKPLLTDIVGINYCLYDKLGADAYTTGFIKFIDGEHRDFFQIPPGKTGNGTLLSGYTYGTLSYPIARVEKTGDYREEMNYAFAVTDDRRQYPALVLRDKGRGKLLYANLPLGHLKAYSDDLPLRAILRSFLFDIVGIPHIVNSPDGLGGLVINWHIDANPDWASIPLMINNGYLRRDVEYSIHITAGDFNEFPGDDAGFAACGEGEKLVRAIMNYGVIGSHGGWGHNWFAENILEGIFGADSMEKYIRMNNKCLSSLTGYPITEYSAPVGVHPQPVNTEVIEKLGFECYYYTGDTGSGPNRTFVNGKMVSDKLISFPIVPFGKSASFGEMNKAGVPGEEIENWLLMLLHYIRKNRTIRLIYSHPYDIPHYPEALKNFIDIADQECRLGNIRIRSMTYFSDFFVKLLNTKYQFIPDPDGMTVRLSNDDNLNSVTVAIPKDKYKRPENDKLNLDEDQKYYYLTLKDTRNEESINIDYR